MSYFIFLKNMDNNNSLHRIAENNIDLENLNIIKTDYKIIETNIDNFNSIKFGLKSVVYSGDNLIFENNPSISYTRDIYNRNIDLYKLQIQGFLNNNKNHLFFDRWNNYLIQLQNLNLENVSFPINSSLVKYLNDSGQPSFNILQLP